MASPERLGDWGEAFAARFLQLCGYRCLDRRFRRGDGELDLVARRGDVLVFVEVKVRGPRSLATAAAWVDGRKLARMRRTARRWLQEHETGGVATYRFDILAITFEGDGRGAVLEHLAGV